MCTKRPHAYKIGTLARTIRRTIRETFAMGRGGQNDGRGNRGAPFGQARRGHQVTFSKARSHPIAQSPVFPVLQVCYDTDFTLHHPQPRQRPRQGRRQQDELQWTMPEIEAAMESKVPMPRLPTLISHPCATLMETHFPPKHCGLALFRIGGCPTTP